MTRSEWQACTDPARLLAHLSGRASDRKLRLFACACCRRIWHLLPEEGCRQAVLAAERYADGLLSKAGLREAEEQAQRITWAAVQAAHAGWDAPLADAARASWVAVWAACAAENSAEPHVWTEGVLGDVSEGPAARSLAARTAQVASWARSVAEDRSAWSALDAGPPDGHAEPEEDRQCDLLRDLFGDCGRPAVLNPDWLRWNDGCLVKMAHVIYHEGNFGDMPVLGDALEDAGCDDADVLEHCRCAPLHSRGCWLLDALLGKN
jgi:hypothetical protein